MFIDRQQAGLLLAERLTAILDRSSVVIGLPRGGIVVAAAVAKKLSLPLDVLIVKKIPSPMQPELGVGALAPDGVSYVDWKLAHRVAADENYLNAKVKELGDLIRTKSILYRKGKKPLDVRDKSVIVVDDGAATGATLAAAITWLRKKKARRIVVALPVAPPEVVSKIKPEVNELVVLETPQNFDAVGQFYEKFPQIEDGDVVQLLSTT